MVILIVVGVALIIVGVVLHFFRDTLDMRADNMNAEFGGARYTGPISIAVVILGVVTLIFPLYSYLQGFGPAGSTCGNHTRATI